jgi:hypothetical protein
MFNTGNGRLGGLLDSSQPLAKSDRPGSVPTGWVCPRCQKVNAPSQPVCSSCSNHISPEATCA